MEQGNKNPVGTRRIQQKEETRALILESARTLFDRSGFKNTTIRAIATLAGVGTGTIFNYFPDKPSLLIAALLDDLEKVESVAFGNLSGDASIVEKCLYITEVYYLYYAKRPSLSRTLLKESNYIPGEFGTLLKTRTNRFIHMVEELMKEAQKKGEIRGEADCGLAAMTFFSLFLRVLFAGLDEAEFRPDELVPSLRGLLEQYMQGIGTKGSYA